MQTTLELIFNSSFTFSIPAWIVFIAVIFACFVLYWDKNLSRLRMNGKPKPTDITHNSFEVSWNKPKFAFPSSYMVYLRKASEPEGWECFTSTDEERSMTITDLPLNTNFIVRVRACAGTETGPIGDESDVITTKNLAFKIKQESTLLHVHPEIPNSLPMYAVQYEMEEYDDKKIRKIIIGEELDDGCIQIGKSILLFSTPHSGKTTLLQGIMNFIFGVSSADGFRLCFAPELTVKNDLYKDWVTVYEFHEYEGGRLDHPFTIIDIPRFHGSKKEYFLRIHDQITSYKTIIDCICFVAQNNTFSLPYEQIEYIQSIKHIFQTDMDTDLSCCFCTFADLGPPHVKEVFNLNNITSDESFMVNWSCLFKRIDHASKFFWVTNFQALDKFFKRVEISDRKWLMDKIKNDHSGPGEKNDELILQIADLQPEVNEYLAKLGDVKIQRDMFAAHENEIKSTGDFEFTIQEVKQTKEPLHPGKHVTNCTICFLTCHEECNIPDDAGKKNCQAMDSKGYCKECAGHCVWYHHKNMTFIYCYVNVEVTKSYKDMKESYEQDHGKPLDFEEYLEHLNKDIEALLERLHENVKKINDCTNELHGIKKRELGDSFDDTIDQMIKSEKIKKEKGYERRIEMFLELKKYTQMKMIKIKQGN